MPQYGPKRHRFLRVLSAALGLLPVTLCLPPAAYAQRGADRYSSIVIDAATGKVLQADDADAERHPASLAKLMTLYLTFQALRDHRITLNEQVPISAHAASMEPTKLGLEPGMPFTVQQAILGIVTRSANDAASALGEFLGGTEDHFAAMMTRKAHALGMTHSHFANASGLPAPGQWTSARDMSLLARRLIDDFPGFYHYFSTPSFVFRGHVILNHDAMLKDYPGVDGMKTGYTNAAGHNLVTSAVRDGHRLIGVELGAPSNAVREARMTRLLNAAFDAEGVAPPTLVLAAAHRHARFAHLPSLISSAHAAEPERRPRLHRPIVRVNADAASAPGAHHRAAWGVQVGAFHSRSRARVAASRTRLRHPGEEVRVERVTVHHRHYWRVRLIGLRPAQAKHTCAKRDRHHRPCMVVRAKRHPAAEL